MDMMYCCHCGWKDKFEGNCPKCNNQVVRNLSTSLYCVECLSLKLDRDKDGCNAGAFTCSQTGHHANPHSQACGDIKIKSYWDSVTSLYETGEEIT